jgi:hypothetical protein
MPAASVLVMLLVGSTSDTAAGFGYLVIAAVIGLVAYVISLKLHPNTNCHRCKGTGKNRGEIFTSSHRQCTYCGGTGRIPRWGTRIFKPQPVRPFERHR